MFKLLYFISLALAIILDSLSAQGDKDNYLGSKLKFYYILFNIVYKIDYSIIIC